MNKRLRFVKDKEQAGILVTKEAVLLEGNKPMLITINSNDLTYTITTNADLQMIDSGQAKDLPTLKKVVKEALINLGVVFEKETRIRKPKQTV